MADRRNSPPTLGQAPWLLMGLLPYYLRHFLWQPYRGDRPSANLRELLTSPIRRHQVAIYDAVLEVLLKGYAELAGHALHKKTGQVAVTLMRLGFAFDDEFDRREAGNTSLDFKEVFHSQGVRLRLREWREFMEDFDAYEEIKNFLTGFVANMYAEYQRKAEETAGHEDFAVMMDRAVLDSGGLLVALAHVVGLFHAKPVTSEIIDQFSGLGVTAKLADDMIDFRDDCRGGLPNLLLALLGDHKGEHARAVRAASSNVRMGARWWSRNCPGAYLGLVHAWEEHQVTLTADSLRYASRIMWVPALLGHTRAETRGRI
jgi:hypothetical protein